MLSCASPAMADIPEDLWEYTTTKTDNGELACTFKEVEVLLPAEWIGKSGMTISDDAVTFYHLASRQAHLEHDGTPGGRLFSLNYSQDYSFTESEPNYSILGSGAEGIYYMSLPTDMQGYVDDAAILSEWKELSAGLDWIKENIFITTPGEGIVTAQDISASVSGLVTDGYILPESSSRLLSYSDVQGMGLDQLQMAINEIYARHHRKFVLPNVQSYFDAQSWYSGTVEADQFDPNTLSSTEWQNITLMLGCMNGANSFASVSDVGTSSFQSSSSSNTGSTNQSDIQIIGGASGSTQIELPPVPSVTVSTSGSTVLYVTPETGANVRSLPQSGSTLVATVACGVGVAVTGETVNGWVPVNCNGITGYIYQDLLTDYSDITIE